MRQAVAVGGGDRWRAVAPEAACELLARLRALKWDWTRAAVPELLQQLGWAVAAELGNAGVVADAGLGLGGREVTIFYVGLGVDSIDLTVTEKVRTRARPARVFVHDGFADLVAAATGAFGEPDLRVHGDFPRVEWRDHRITIAITRGSAAVHAAVTPNDRRDYWDMFDMEPPWLG